VSRPDLLEHLRGDAAGRALVFQTLEHLGFSPKEHLEQLAQLLGTCLFLTGRLQGLTVFLGLVPQG
jgi:type VI protein secretion system component VasF